MKNPTQSTIPYFATAGISSLFASWQTVMAISFFLGLFAISATAAPPDLTNGGVPDHTSYINLGPTGLTGWVYREKDPKALLTDLNHTGSSRQIKVTAVATGSPAVPAGILANDVILGASGDGSTPLDFTSDARKSLALAIAAAEARTTPELKLKVWRAGVTSNYTLTLQNLGAYGPNAPVSDAKCAQIVENARQAFLANSYPAAFGFGTLALMALDDPNHPGHAAMKAQIDAEIAAMLPDAATLAMMNSGIPETADNRVGWNRGHKLIVLAEYYLIYGEHPNGGVLQAIQAHVNSVTTGQSIFGTFGHIYAQFRWPDDANTPMMGGYGAINSSAVPGLYGLLLAKQCNVSNPKLDECINRAVTFYGSYAGRGCIPYGEHEPASTEYSSNGKSGAAALLLDLVPGKEAEGEFFTKMSAAGFTEYESGHSGCFFNNLWSPLGAAHGGDDAIKNYFAQNSWLYDLARKWDGSFAYNIIYYGNNYTTFNASVPYILTYALPLKRLHMTGRGRSAEGVLDATQRAQALVSGLYDETIRTKTELIADLGDWSPVVHTRAVNALAAMSLTSTDLDTLHALASDPQGSSREGALMVLEKAASPSSAPVLSAILSDPDPHIRRLAAKALLLNPAKAGELNTVLAATGAAKRPVFPMDPRDPLQHDLYAMGLLLFSTDNDSAKRGILCVYPNIVLTGVDRQLLYPAVRAVASSASGISRSTLGGLLAALTEADAKELGDVLVDTAYYRSPADPMFADVARSAAMDAMVRFTLAEAIPVAERSIRADFTSNANRGLYGEMFEGLQTFGGTNLLVTPDPDILQLCMDYIREHTNFSPTNAAQAELLMDVIQADRSPAAPNYLKSFNWAVSDAATLTLPANQTQLHASVTDHAKGELTYTWRKVYGAGNVTFSSNGSAASKDTTVTFDNTPGHYLFEVAVIDARGLTEIKKTVAMTLYDTNGTLPSNQPPTATPQSITVAPGTPMNLTLTGSDPESAMLLFTVTQPPYYGSLSGTAPNLIYAPDLSYHNGADSFTFEVTDSFGQTSSATVSITVDSSLLVTHVHEPFDYPVGALVAGNAGGTGMTGNWLDGPVTGKAWIYDETTVATPVNTGAGTYSWDGVVDNLPTHVETGAKMVGLSPTHGGDSFEIHRPLAQTAGAMAGADKVLWASVAYHRAADSFAQNLGLALTTDCFTNGGRSLDTSGTHGSGAGDGIGVARPFDIGKSYCAVVFDGGSAVASTTAPTFGTGDFVMVLKFEFGVTDKVSAYAFREYETISEASFDQRAVVATAAIDENTLNRLTVTASRGDPSYDEIRIGDTLAAVVGLGESPEDVIPPNPNPITFSVAPTASASSISMTATTATDSSGVEYYFTCTSGGGKDSGWQDSPSYTDLSLGAGTYSYTVKARDKSVNWNLTGSSTPSSATIVSATPGQIAWNVFNISGNVSDVSTVGTLVSAHGGADLGIADVVDGSNFVINGVTFDDGFVFDSPSHKDGLGSRGGTYPAPNAAYGTLMSIADRQGTGNATFTFNNLTIGNTYQIQVWHGDNVSTALQNGLVVNTGGTATTPAPAAPGHATLVREISEGGYGQYAIGTFVAGASTQQFLARAYGSLTTTPVVQSNTTINGCQLRMIATGTVSTPPTLASSDIVDDQGGAPVPVGTVVAYDVTFSKAMNGSTINHADFSNVGTASGTIGTVAALSPSTYRVRFHALTTGTLQLRVNAGSVITDLAGNPLNTTAAILDDTIISVVPANSAPVWAANPVNEANAAEDATYNSALADNAADADNDTLVFAKVSGPAWLNVATDGSLSGTPTQADVGINGFTVSVTDNITAPVEGTLEIIVININDAPVFTENPIMGVNATEDAAYTGNLDGSAIDADGNTLEYAKVSGPSWLSIAANGVLSGTPSDADVGANVFTVSVTDGIAAPVTATLNITVINTNDGPVFVSNPITGNDATEDAAYSGTLDGSATDDDGDTLNYAKVSGPAWLIVATDGALSGTPTNTDAGENIFTVSVTDGNSTPVQATFNITVNPPPGANLLAYEGFNYPVGELLGLNGGNGFASGWADSNGTSFQGYVRDETTNVFFDSTTLNWDGVLSNGFPTFPSTGSRYMASDAQTSSNVDVKRTLAASAGAMAGGDGVLWMSAVYRFPNGASGASINFGLTDGGNLTDRGRRTSSMTMDFVGVSGWNGSTTWNQQVNPTIIDSTTATGTVWDQFVRTPGGVNMASTVDKIIVLKFTFGASDTVEAFWFDENTPLASMTKEAFNTGKVGATYAAGIDENNLNTIVYSQGRFDNAVDEIRIGDSFEVVVGQNPPENTVPTWATNPVNEANATEDAAYAATLANDATDADSDPLTFAKVGGPTWLNIATNGTLSGTPSNADVGSNAFTVSVTDNNSPAVEATLNITVINANDAPVFTVDPINGSDATEDIAYSGTIAGSASDDDGNNLVYAKVSGPAWLSVAPDGMLSGTPGNADAGANAFTVSVTDNIAAPVTAALNIAVINTNDAPVWAGNPISGANANEDEVYSGNLATSATDVDAGASLSFAKVSGPAWLSVATNGALSGTPANSDVGSNSFTVSITDGIAAPVTTGLNITVINTNDAPVWTLSPIIAAGAEEGAAYTGQTLAGEATDADAADTISYSKVSGPAWLVVASNGALSGTPPTGSAGLNSFVVRATDSASATADATLEITVTGLPLPWVSTDIGTGMLAGSATFNAGTFTQAGSGIIGSTSDKLHYTYQTLTGDGEIIARITNLQNTGSSSRVGVMIRDSLAANSKEIFMGMTSSNAYRWVRRTATGGSTTSSNSSTGTVPSTWVRLVRSGTTITAYKSTNGTSWTTVGSTTNTTFASTCYIGIAVGSGSTTTLNTSQFSNVSVTP